MWERLWSVALFDLRLSEKQFFRMTLRMLDALIQRSELEWERRELLFGIVATTTANYSAGMTAENMKEPHDFMPSQLRKKHHEGTERLRGKIRELNKQTRKLKG